MTGSFFPIQLVYYGKTTLSQPKDKFPKEFHITQTPNHIGLMKKQVLPSSNMALSTILKFKGKS